MKFLKRTLLFLLVFVIIPWIATVVLLKFTATPLINKLLTARVNAVAKVGKVDVNWLLTQLVVENLNIENPPGFERGPMLSLKRGEVNLSADSYFSFKPYLTVELQDFYLHFIRRNDNVTNLAVAFGLPIKRAKVNPIDFKLKKVNAVFDIKTLKEVDYQITGIFQGMGNDANFTLKGEGDFSNREFPKTTTDFVITNWHIKENPLLTQLLVMVNPQWITNELILAKVEGTVATDGPWVIFVKRNTKAYTVNNVLFAEVYKGSKYNRITKELDLTVALYLPYKMVLKIGGTLNHPQVNIEKAKIPTVGNGFLPTKGLKLPLPSNGTLKTNPLQEIKEKVNKAIEQTKEELKKNLEETLKEILGN